MTVYARQAKLLKTLTHPVRLAILDTLSRDDACVCHVEAVVDLRQAYISQQLMILREAGLIETRREGWNVYYRLAEPRILPVLAATRAAVGEAAPERPTGAAPCGCPKCAREPASGAAGGAARRAMRAKE